MATELGLAWQAYLSALKTDFTKLCKLEFLQPDGSIAFVLDNNPKNPRSKAFIQEGSLNVNLQNGSRRQANITLANLTGEFDYNVNKRWFGEKIRLLEGLPLPNGQEFYLPQGVFYIKDPEETIRPNLRIANYNLVDKWAALDGILGGNLDGIYEVPYGSNIFEAMASILRFPKGNGQIVDDVPPIFTNYYNNKTQTLPDGTVVSLIDTPYVYRCDSDDGNYATILLELNDMLAGWIGYNAMGALQVDPSQDDILDINKPIQWAFTPTEKQFLGATYTVKNSEVYNDVIIRGESLDEYAQVGGRATNFDPSSDTNANLIGLKTKTESASGYFTNDICEALAVFRLKRMTTLLKSVTIESAQMFHIAENNLVTVRRADRNNAVERHLVTGFTRPLAQTGAMQIHCTSVQDFPIATLQKI